MLLDRSLESFGLSLNTVDDLVVSLDRQLSRHLVDAARTSGARAALVMHHRADGELVGHSGSPFAGIERQNDNARRMRRAFSCRSAVLQAFCRLAAACLPRSVITSYETRWPSLSVLIPARSTALMCTNTSREPSDGVMKPKPFCMLKNFTVPVAMMAYP